MSGIAWCAFKRAQIRSWFQLPRDLISIIRFLRLGRDRNGQTGKGLKSCFQFPTVRHHSISVGLQ